MARHQKYARKWQLPAPSSTRSPIINHHVGVICDVACALRCMLAMSRRVHRLRRATASTRRMQLRLALQPKAAPSSRGEQFSFSISRAAAIAYEPVYSGRQSRQRAPYAGEPTAKCGGDCAEAIKAARVGAREISPCPCLDALHDCRLAMP